MPNPATTSLPVVRSLCRASTGWDSFWWEPSQREGCHAWRRCGFRSNRGPQAERKRKLEAGLRFALQRDVRASCPAHRGIAGLPPNPGCICASSSSNARVVRWPHRQYLIDDQGRARHPPGRWREANAPGASGSSGMRICTGIWRQRCSRSPCAIPILLDPMFLVVSRQGKGRRPWYLLTRRRGPHRAAGLEDRLCLCSALGYRGDLAGKSKANWALNVHGCATPNAVANC